MSAYQDLRSVLATDRIGRVAALPTELVALESQSMARLLEIRFDDGERAVPPRANVEAIEA